MSGGKHPKNRKYVGFLLSLIITASLALGLGSPVFALDRVGTANRVSGLGGIALPHQPEAQVYAIDGNALSRQFPPTPTPTNVLSPTPTSPFPPTPTPTSPFPLTPTPTPTPFFIFPTNTPFPTRTPRPTATPVPTPVPTAFPGGLNPQVIIPTGFAPRIDGVCNPFEYRDALAVSFVDGNNTTGTVYLKHDRSNLYVCMSGALGSNPSRFVGVYIDPDHGREAYPHADELSFRADLTTPTIYTLQGANAPGSYVPVTVNGWVAKTTAITSDQVEYSISLMLLGCDGAFGLAVYHHWFAAPANDYGWPYSQYYDQPGTWAVAGLDTGIAATCNYLPMVFR